MILERSYELSKVVNVRELLGFEPKELLEGLRTNLNVKFEDNVVTNIPYKELIIMRYLMEMRVTYQHLYLAIAGLYLAITINSNSNTTIL